MLLGAMDENKLSQTAGGEAAIKEDCASSECHDSAAINSLDKEEAGIPICRVCQCVEPDKLGDIALEYLGIALSVQDKGYGNPNTNLNLESSEHDRRDRGFIEIISPEGEAYICRADLEMGHPGGSLLELGCSCKSDLALVHYACALKWFINHGSTVCEICGHVAKSIKLADFKKVESSLKDYEVLKERIASGEPNPVQANTVSGVAAIRRQRLSEISLWFNPNHSSSNVQAFQNNASTPQAASEQPLATGLEDNTLAENPPSSLVFEAVGILFHTVVLTYALTWVIAPRVGKKTARSGLYILPTGVCVFAVVVFFRVFVLSRIKDGPARSWAILISVCFVMGGILVLQMHGPH